MVEESPGNEVEKKLSDLRRTREQQRHGIECQEIFQSHVGQWFPNLAHIRITWQNVKDTSVSLRIKLQNATECQM